MDYLEVEKLHFADFLGKKVSPVVQSTSPVHRSSPPIVYSLNGLGMAIKLLCKTNNEQHKEETRP